MSVDYPLLNTINTPAGLRTLSNEQLRTLADELRTFMVDSVLQTGGHLSSSLGAVELCLALHCELNTPQDGLIWDVGHQAYAHKIITGRREQFHTLRQAGGISAFLNPSESEYDAFVTGHAGNSVSAALGMALASQLNQQNATHCAVVGDGALTSGMVFEALNHAGSLELPLLIVVNDNDWSISKNMGALQNSLHQDTPDLRLFESLDIATPIQKTVDGHDIDTLRTAIKQSITHAHAKKTAVVLYVKTQKGHGYAPAEQNPLKYHGVKPNTADLENPTDSEQGASIAAEAKREHADSLKHTSPCTYSKVFGDWLHHAMSQDERIVAITPAMIEGSGLQRIAQDFPKRLFDVGIAEQHAVTLAAGLAQQGMRPVVAIYSTFLQRAYDQVIHDVALQNFPIVFAIDRAGVVGADGSTHHGTFDISFMRTVPNMHIFTPSNTHETVRCLNTALRMERPVAVRYPRDVHHACSHAQLSDDFGNMNRPKARIVRHADSLKSPCSSSAIMVFGSLLSDCIRIADTLNATLVDMRSVKPLDGDTLKRLTENHKHWITVEEHAIAGGAGSTVAEWLSQHSPNTQNIRIQHLGLSDTFIGHGSRTDCLREAGLDKASLTNTITQWVNAFRNSGG